MLPPAAKKILRLALAQINPTVGDLDGNTKKILASMEHARQAKVDLILFPEQVLPGYPAEDLLLKKQFVRDNLGALRKIQAASKGLTAVVGFINGKDNTIYNAAAILHEGKLCAVYHKIHLPNYGVFDEKRYFTPGAKPLLWNISGARVGLSICEDIWVPGPARFLAQAGARIVLNISASPYHVLKGKERGARLARRARENEVCIAYVNMVGGQDEIVFDGQSVVVDAKGRVVARAKAFAEDLLIVDIPPVANKARSVVNKPLSVEEEMLQALITGTRDYVRKNGFQKVVFGLSGGVDSALVAAIAAEALGADNVIGVFMPSCFSSVQSLQDAKAVAENLRIRLETVGIDRTLQSYLAELKPFFAKLPSDSAEENLQARIRGNILMAFSNKFGWLVLTTGNKSETSVGYCTLYGDMAGGFAVIKDLFKKRVYRLARHVNKRAGRTIIPESVLTKEPTAELRPHQKDSDTLPPYPQLDPVLEAYVEKNLGVNDLDKAGFDPAMIKQVVRWVDSNEYKRRQAPPGVKITPLAFGKDRRYPITNRYNR